MPDMPTKVISITAPPAGTVERGPTLTGRDLHLARDRAALRDLEAWQMRYSDSDVGQEARDLIRAAAERLQGRIEESAPATSAPALRKK